MSVCQHLSVPSTGLFVVTCHQCCWLVINGRTHCGHIPAPWWTNGLKSSSGQQSPTYAASILYPRTILKKSMYILFIPAICRANYLLVKFSLWWCSLSLKGVATAEESISIYQCTLFLCLPVLSFLYPFIHSIVPFNPFMQQKFQEFLFPMQHACNH